MSGADSYWYNLGTGEVVRASGRESAEWLGPFGSSAEAAEAPEVLLQQARAWVESEEGERYLEQADGSDPDSGAV